MQNTMKKNAIEELLELAKQNPELPIVALVNDEIVGESGYGYWVGEFGICRLDEYLLPPDGSPIIFRSDDDVFDALERMLPEGKFNALPEEEDKCRPYYDDLPWKEAIIVYVETI